MLDYDLKKIEYTDIELSTCPICKNILKKNIVVTFSRQDVKTENYYCNNCKSIWIKDLLVKN